MPIPIAVPVIGTLVLALISDATENPEQQRPNVYRKSIEVCTAQCSAQWIKEDGVLRVYHEESHLECAQIIVEMTHMGSFAPPTSVDGHPVLVRMQR